MANNNTGAVTAPSPEIEEVTITTLQNLRDNVNKDDLRVLVPIPDEKNKKIVFKYLKLSQIPLLNKPDYNLYNMFMRDKEDPDKFIYLHKEHTFKSDYVTFLQELKESDNKIEDTDKVCFAKNSKFPKISFNRYSNKAKKVNSFDKADKIVLSPFTRDTWSLFVSAPWKRYRTEPTFYEKNGIVYAVPRYADNWSVINFIRYFFPPGSTASITICSTYLDKFNTITYQDISGKEVSTGSFDIGYLKNNINQTGWNTNTAGIDSFAFIIDSDLKINDIQPYNLYNVYNSPKNYNTVTSILDTDKNKENYLLDMHAEDYINKFKDGIDDDMYELLTAQLTGNKDTVNLALNLISNMDLKSNRAYVISLFSFALDNHRHVYNQIRASKTYRSVAFKKARSLYQLDFIMERFNPRNIHSYGPIFNMIKTDEEFDTLARLSKPIVLRALEQSLGKRILDNLMKDNNENV